MLSKPTPDHTSPLHAAIIPTGLRKRSLCHLTACHDFELATVSNTTLQTLRAAGFRWDRKGPYILVSQTAEQAIRRDILITNISQVGHVPLYV